MKSKHVFTKRSVWAVAAIAVVGIIVAVWLLVGPAAKADNPVQPPQSPVGPAVEAVPADSPEPSPAPSAFQESWEKFSERLGLSVAESQAWQTRLQKDIPRLVDCYIVKDCHTDDYDANRVRDLIVLLQSTEPEDPMPGAYLGVYMNDDPVYLESYEDSLYLGFNTMPGHGDIDDDGYPEIVLTVFTGGVGGAGSSYKDVLKYKDHTLTQMVLPGDDTEEFEGDAGYAVKVLFGGRENQYKAVCGTLGQTVTFDAPNAVDESGQRLRRIVEDEEAGGNCRGYADLSIIERDGREYLQAAEYLYGEGGIAHCVGFATFLIDWVDGEPTVLEFGVEGMPISE